MGNCLFGGFGEEADGPIKVVTPNGGIMEFSAPISAQDIVGEFPGHAIFRSNDLLWKPVLHHEELLPGESYHLLPLNSNGCIPGNRVIRDGHVRSESDSVPLSAIAPYRLSCDVQGTLKRCHTDIFSRYNSSNNDNRGFWKVKLAISPEQLLEILSQETRTQELIENVRTVAKCRSGISTAIGFSDQWSLSNSRNTSSSKDDLFLEM